MFVNKPLSGFKMAHLAQQYPADGRFFRRVFLFGFYQVEITVIERLPGNDGNMIRLDFCQGTFSRIIVVFKDQQQIKKLARQVLDDAIQALPVIRS